ncbi:MAG: Gfo/Idh/MocA family protein, partial [Planctomycetota bacterium]
RTEAYYASGGWRATWGGEGGGVLANQCPHNLDLWQWVLGMPKRVSAVCSFGKYHNIEVEDEVNAYMEYENGATAQFVTTTGEAPGTNRWEIVGDKGKLVVEGGKLALTKNAVSAREFGKTSKESFASPKTETTDVPVPEGGGAHW